MSDTVLMIGCGRMGGAIARALTASHRVLAFDPHAATLPDGVERAPSLAGAAGCTIVILAVKPQSFTGIAPELPYLAAPGTLFLSIMAGIPLARLRAAVGGEVGLVRAMPNTPAAIGHGITAAVASDNVTPTQRDAVAAILAPTGPLLWLDGEGDLDAVTALSGSGPAYFFRFTEALVQAGMAEGLSAEIATRLARQTFIGAARLAELETAGLDELRRQVTSPGGTTAAGLGVMDGDIDILAEQMVRAAAARSRELAG